MADDDGMDTAGGRAALDAASEVDRLVREHRLDAAADVARTALASAHLPLRPAARLRLTLSSILLMSGHPDQSIVQADVVAAQAGLDERTHTSAQLARLLALMAQGELAAARVPAATLLAETPPADPYESLGGAFTTMGSIAWTDGRVADSIAFFRAAIARAEGGQLAERAMHPRQSVSIPLTLLGQFDEAAAFLAEDAEDATTPAANGWRIGTHVRRSRLLFARGQIDGAIAEAVTGIELADASGARLFVPTARSTLASAALLAGDLIGAAAELVRGEDEPLAARGSLVPSMSAWIQARIAYEQHGPTLAVKTLSEVFDNLPANKRILLEEPGIAPWMVRTALAADDRRRAATVVAATDHLAADNPGMAPVGAIARHARGIFDEDVDGLTEGAALHSQPWPRASAAEDAGTLTAHADPAGARALLA
ncbi:MAG: Transcriptional regulator, partial [Acidimicrobiales bacterium]|nr:Transcriptional regulator [Acidimicrobiales bacterium]